MARSYVPKARWGVPPFTPIQSIRRDDYHAGRNRWVPWVTRRAIYYGAAGGFHKKYGVIFMPKDGSWYMAVEYKRLEDLRPKPKWRTYPPGALE